MNDQQRAAMQMALEALEKATMVYEANDTHPLTVQRAEDAITALREALAQPQGEWVAIVHNTDTPGNWSIIKPGLPAGTQLYTTPPSVEAAIEATKERAAKIADYWAENDDWPCGTGIAAAIRSMK